MNNAILLDCLLLTLLQYIVLHQIVAVSPVDRVVDEFNEMLASMVDNDGLFDKHGSIDAAVWKKDESGRHIPIYQGSFGMAQYKRAKEDLADITGRTPSPQLKAIADGLGAHPDVKAMNSTDKRNIYRIASNTKSLIGVTAFWLKKHHGLNLDDKISPKFLDLSRLGEAHNWHNPKIDDGFDSPQFPNASSFASEITFRHLLTHTAGLSREGRRGDDYPYASSRTNTLVCPDTQRNSIEETIKCDFSLKENNWQAWTQNIVQYMMPACGFNKYPEKSHRKSCLPGEYFHYSNAGYSLLGLALENFVKMNGVAHSLTEGILEHILGARELGMRDTVWTWTDMSREQKLRTAMGCNGGGETCDNQLPVTDFADHGIKTPPGGVWSTTNDMTKFLLSLNDMDLSGEIFDQIPFTVGKSAIFMVQKILSENKRITELKIPKNYDKSINKSFFFLSFTFPV